MKKYSIIINPIGDKYALVMSSWIEKDGKKSDVKSVAEIDCTTIEECMIEVTNFISL